MHQRYLQFLAIELCKVLNGLSPDLMKDVFDDSDDDSGYSTRNKRAFKSRNGKQQIVLVAFVKTIYLRLASCSIISKYEPHENIVMYASLFMYLSFIYIYIKICKLG